MIWLRRTTSVTLFEGSAGLHWYRSTGSRTHPRLYAGIPSGFESKNRCPCRGYDGNDAVNKWVGLSSEFELSLLLAFIRRKEQAEA